MTIRKAKLNDIKAITKLLYHLFTQEVEFSFSKKLHKKALRKIINDKTIGEIFVIVKNDKIIGCVNILYTISTALGSRVAFLEDMIIAPKYRGKNLGTKLLKYVSNYLTKKDIKRITLLTDKENTKAHQFYTKQNFQFSKMVVYRKIL
jgi:N-acetylglutamate synthase-like GNAT family acetyltransferase